MNRGAHVVVIVCVDWFVQKGQKGDPMALLKRQLEEKETALQEGKWCKQDSCVQDVGDAIP